MELFFQNSQGVERLISKPETKEQAFNDIKSFLDEHNYTMYYCIENINKEDSSIRFDVGSHTEFFYLRNIPKNILK